MTALYLIAYDIADPRRLGRIHRFLQQCALPIQYSVFLAPCNPTQLDDIVAGLRQRLDPNHDDVRIYHLPQRCEPQTLGRQWLPEGVLLSGSATLMHLQPSEP